MRYIYFVLIFLSSSFASNVPQVPNRVKVPESVSMKHLLKRVEPQYPSAAKAACVRGDVSLVVIVSADGSVKSAKAISGPVELRGVAETAVKGWKYEPYRLNDKPVEQETTATLRFQLPSALCPPLGT